MKVDKLGHLIDRIVDGPSEGDAVLSIDPGSGERDDRIGFLVFDDKGGLRVRGRGYGHAMYEQWVGGKFLVDAKADADGSRCHVKNRGYGIVVGPDTRIGMRRVGEWWFIGLAYVRLYAPGAEALAKELNQPGIFSMPSGVLIPRRDYGDYRMNSEPTLDTVRTNLSGTPLDVNAG